MDVIALDRAGIAEAVAPNGTAVTEAQLERMWRLDPSADPLLRRRQRRARRPRSAPPAAPFPSSRPNAPCASSSCPPARTPTTSSAAAAATRSRPCSATPEPLVERLWRHELTAQPLTTPEARAGLRQRLIEHAGRSATRRSPASTATNGSAASSDEVARPRQYQPQPFRRAFQPGQRGGVAAARAARRRRQRRAIAAAASTAHRPRAHPRFRQFPRGAGASIASSSRRFRSPRRRSPVSATGWSMRPFPAKRLIARHLLPYCATSGTAADLERARRTGTMAFSFTRSDTAPDRAVRDLGTAIDALTADGEIGAALAGGDRAVEGRRRGCVRGAASAALATRGDQGAAGVPRRQRLSGGTTWRKTKQ